MYQVLIADDEAIERNALKMMLENNIASIEVTGEAENGVQLLQMLKKNRYDIAVVDIEMPGLSGLEVLQMAQKELENTRVIIFTAYSNFDYAQMSLRYHAFDYLLKPTRRDKLMATIERCVEDIEAARRKSVNSERLKKIIGQIRPLMDEELLNSFCTGSGDFARLKVYLNALEISTETGYIVTFRIRDRRKGQMSPEDSLDQLALKKSVAKKLSTGLSELVEHSLAQVQRDKITAFIPVERPGAEYQNRVDSINLVHIILDRIQLPETVEVIAGIGSVQESLEQMHLSYRESISALHDTKTNMAIRHYNDLFDRKEQDWHILQKEQKQLLAAIRDEDMEKQKKMIDQIFFVLHKKPPEECSSHILEMMVQILHSVDPYFSENQDHRFHISRLCRECMNIGDTDSLKRWLTEYCQNLSREMNVGSHTGIVIEQARKYIDDNYQEDLSLNDVSRHCNVSIYYMSRLFKEKMGENYSTYLTRVRMEAAKEMIREYDYPLKTLSDKCGFRSVGYFCRVFKQYTGVTVGEFKEQR